MALYVQTNDTVTRTVGLLDLGALGTIGEQRIGAAVAFDLPAQYNTATSPSASAVTADYTGAVPGTQVLCWFNHGAEPSWPSGWVVVGPWNAGAANAVVLTYSGGTTVSGYIVSEAAGTPSNPESMYYLTGDWSIGSNGTPTQLTGFSGIPILAGKLYAVDMRLRGTCSGTGGLRLGWWVDTGTDHILRMAGRTDFTANAGVYFVPGSNQGYNSLQLSYAFFAATLANNFCQMSGTLRGGAVDGVFEMRGSSVTASQTSTVYADGSYVRVTRMN